MALTRALPGLPPLNIGEAISLPEVIAASAQQGARAIGRGHKIGTLSVGKSAVFILLDRDILALPITDVAAAKVVQTWFLGGRCSRRTQKIFRSAHRPELCVRFHRPKGSLIWGLDLSARHHRIG